MPEPANYVDNTEFENDLVEYLKNESMENWNRLVEKYPFDAKGKGRFSFLPTGHEKVDPSARTDFMVQRPQIKQDSPIDIVDDDIYAEIAGYMDADDAVEKLDILASLEDRYDHTWISDDVVRFGPTPENGVTVSVPNLGEIAEAYNNREEIGLGLDERDMLTKLASESSETVGTLSKTVYVQDGDIYVQDDEKNQFYQVTAIGEALGLDEAIDVYKMIREDSTTDSGKEVFDSISRVFEAAEIDPYKILIDSENKEMMMMDTETMDLAVVGFEQANEWLAQENEDIVGRIDEFYQRLTPDDED